MRKRYVTWIAILGLLSLGGGGGWYAYRVFGSARAPMTTAAISALAKSASLENRVEWLRLGRAVLESEGVRAIAAPEEPINNRGEASRVELGHLLFFDPILSGDRTTSCASCHHPDHGMADGLPKGIGVGGKGFGLQRAGTGTQLQRNTPSIFNVAFNKFNFWDGRAGSLEEQVFSPLFSEDEMNLSSTEELLKRLRAIPKYRDLFGKAFGVNSKADGAEITLPNVTRAIAAFERKLNIIETPYDLFVKGQDDRLTTEQLRGMIVFFGPGQCAVCHIPPHFHDDAVASIGVTVSPEKGAALDADPGFAAVIRRQDAFGMFKTPGLRNIERTAPFMHNGAFKTLEEVIEFYNDGGGRGRGLDVLSQDAKIMKLDLTEQQKKDLVSFLKSLTDLSPAPAPPAAVPSGLPVTGK